MPTPVISARQCLTDEAARALDEAVSVARRRGHAQTTSLHAVSALLGFPSSLLRDACARARGGSAYSPRLHFRALELSVGVSLDRLPSSKAASAAADEPPVSNSLMAAIKRSQANQRRHPESFHLYQLQMQQYQQQQQQPMSISCIKVELKHFVLSILDDPIVSKVFAEAGFRSYDIKDAILHPPAPPLPRFSRPRCPPLFLGSLPWVGGADSVPGGASASPSPSASRRSFPFPISGSSSFSSSWGSVDGDQNWRRIGEILAKDKGKGKNPLLIGVCASDALSSFVESVRGGKQGVLPPQIAGLKLVSVQEEVLDFVVRGGSEEQLSSKLKECEDHIISDPCSSEPGLLLLINLGELMPLVGDAASSDAMSHVVSKLTSLLGLHADKLRLIGAADTYETYSKFIARFLQAEKEWDLELLPITSSNPSSSDGLYPKSSLIGSFVPFGGFFPTPSDFKSPLNSGIQSERLCHLCNEKCEQEVSAVLKGESGTSVSDQHSTGLPAWLRMVESDPPKGIDVAKVKDGAPIVDAKIMGLRKKWIDTCQRLHHAKALPLMPCSETSSQVTSFGDFPFVADRKQNNSEDSSLNVSGCKNSSHCQPMEMNKNYLSKHKAPPFQVVSEAENVNFLSRLQGRALETQQSNVETPRVSLNPPSNLSMLLGCSPLSSSTSVTTDLQLGMLYGTTNQESKNRDTDSHNDRLQNLSSSVSAAFHVASEDTSKGIAGSPSSSRPFMGGRLDPTQFKALWKTLFNKVGRQNEAICTISQTICTTGNRKNSRLNHKGNIWLSFLGPDKLGKKKVATALAEIIFGNGADIISVDLSPKYEVCHAKSIFDSWEVSNVEFRGKTVVDYISAKLLKKPNSVVFLENVDKADPLARRSLSQAVRTGKFPDSHGREININNTIFVATSSITEGSNFSVLPEKETLQYSEERILRAKSWQMHILTERVAGDALPRTSGGMNVFVKPSEGLSNLGIQRKRKTLETGDPAQLDGTPPEVSKRADQTSKSFLDLNLPLEETQEGINTGGISDTSNYYFCENWLKDFHDQVDARVVFSSFDFDALADRVLKEISLNLRKTLGHNAFLEIDLEVMAQLLAAGWLSEEKKALEDWIVRVLSKSFAEARQRYDDNPANQSVLRLVAREGLPVEEHAPGVHLPARVGVD